MASADAEKKEMKAEGIVDAASELAQDPKSKVNPEKVEEALVNEVKEAGVPVFQFDADASPEDKAAAAKAVGTNILGIGGRTIQERAKR